MFWTPHSEDWGFGWVSDNLIFKLPISIVHVFVTLICLSIYISRFIFYLWGITSVGRLRYRYSRYLCQIKCLVKVFIWYETSRISFVNSNVYRTVLISRKTMNCLVIEGLPLQEMNKQIYHCTLYIHLYMTFLVQNIKEKGSQIPQNPFASATDRTCSIFSLKIFSKIWNVR